MRSKPEAASYWRQHIEALRESGLTWKAYCEKNQIKLSTLAYWHHKLNPSGKQNKKAVEVDWIPLQVNDDESSSIDLKMGRLVVTVRSGFDPSLLTELLRTIGALC
jgi:hypothetical protein